jgi:hypothetical protein
MSLLDAFLEDALYDPPIVQQNTYFARRLDAVVGAGTYLNPYNTLVRNSDGTDNVNLSADRFDALMEALPTYAVIFLGPGTIYSRGTKSGAQGFYVKSGQRIVGSGLGSTTLKLVDTASASTSHLFSSSASTQLDSLEISDLQIDCNTASGRNRGAISVAGKNVFVRRVRAFNYAPGTTSSLHVVFRLGSASMSVVSQNCVMESCVAQDPGTFAGGSSAVIVQLEGDASHPHEFCSVRECFLDGGGASNDVTGIDPGLGRGTIVESTNIHNCKYAVKSENTPSIDTIIRDSFFYSTRYGIYFTNTGTAIGRLVVTGTRFDLLHDGVTAVRAVHITGFGTGFDKFDQVLCRKNIIRDLDTAAGTTTELYGFKFENCKNVIVEDNLINNVDVAKAIEYRYCQSIKAFNNQSTAAVLLRANNAGAYKLQLEDEVQDAILTY